MDLNGLDTADLKLQENSMKALITMEPQIKSGLNTLIGLQVQLIVNIILKELFLTLSVTQQLPT